MVSIGGEAFNNCDNIKEIYVGTVNPPICTLGAFPESVKKNATLYVPPGTFASYWSSTEWEDFNIVEKQFEPVTSINITDSFEIIKDVRVRLPYSISPATASIPNLTFNSSDTSIAEVSSDGFIIGKAAGTTMVSIGTQDGSNLQVKCKIVVKNPSISVFEMSSKSLILNIGEQANLTVSIKPENTNKVVNWSSANDEIAVVKKIDGGAVVLARAIGETDIIASSEENTEIKDTCHVIVVENSVLVGDVNEDGTVDKNDLDTLMEILLNRKDPTSMSDVNRDGVINGLDFVVLSKRIEE